MSSRSSSYSRGDHNERDRDDPRKGGNREMTSGAEPTMGHTAIEDQIRDAPCSYDWNNKNLSSCLCGCFSFLVQLILVGSVGSFLFGFNLSLLNTCVNHIAWEFRWCTDILGDFTTNDAGVVDGVDIEITGCNKAVNFMAFISTAVFIGAAIGSMTGGVFLSYGRRGMYIISMAVFVFGIVSSCCANSFTALLWARLVCGYAVGLISVVVPSYMSEMTPSAVRGYYGVFHQLFITVGILAGNLVGLPLALADPLPTHVDLTDPSNIMVDDIATFSKIWWRVMLGIGILPVILCSYLLLSVYTFETPHYYIEKNLIGDAEQLLKRILQKEDVRQELTEAVNEIESGKRAKEQGMSLGAAFGNPELRKVIIFGCVLSAFQQLSGINVFIASSNALFIDAGLTGYMPTVISIVMTLVNCVMTIPAVPLIEALGRRSLLVIGTFGMTCSVLPATICYWSIKDAESPVTRWLAIVGCILFIIFFAATYGPVLWVYLFEIYPIEIKGSASGLATAFNWVAGILMVFVTSYVDNKISYLIFTIMCGCAFVVIFMFMLETKGRVLGDSPYVTGGRH